MSVETIGADAAVSFGTLITANVSANTKGSWVELTASSSINAQAIIVVIRHASGGDGLLDIGTGGAGAESVVISDLPCHAQSDIDMAVHYIPLPIASGTRIAARFQSTTGSDLARAAAYLIATTVKLEEVTSVAAYGAVSADSGGTQIDPGATINTKGSWVEITSSLSADVKFIIPMFHNRNNSARSTCGWLIDIGTGAGGSESVAVANIHAACAVGGDVVHPSSYPPIPIEIPSGTRVAVRAQCSINDATDRLFDFSMITANGTAVPGAQNVVIPRITRVM